MTDLDRLIVRIDRLPLAMRTACRVLLDQAVTMPRAADRQNAVVCLHVLIDEHLKLTDRITADRLGADRKQAKLTREYNRAEAGRVTLVHGMDRIENGIDRLELHSKIEEDVATELRRLTTEAVDKHREAWKP